ncbi:MAG: bifunctional demethylmenaquinone methyltransferase/2-methoxy-6-polyprenyl-1,4-benzoquinol methylase UbiE [Chlamydiia bacterium]|nr:bifunctional demethylmenaquinone methyltransferase/2-methoxy-6-polyprenyl-1,4-benzoquinol methylase UbiE [Chlamydiia bacterium]
MKYQATTPKTIQSLFNDIAPGYDKTNSLLSFGLYRFWNRSLIKTLEKEGVLNLLDLCAGTGEIALGFLKKEKKGKSVLLDFSKNMLEIAKQKGEKVKDRMECLVGDAMHLPHAAEMFDGVSVAYGIRNVSQPKKCVSEAYRVLKPLGIFAILELTRPTLFPLNLFHTLFLKTVLPLVGRMVTNNKAAYQYLCDSIHHFISPKMLSLILQEEGFIEVQSKKLLGGVATLIVGKKPPLNVS